MIFYNKDMLKKAGVDPENPPLSTYDEFLATSEKIVEQRRGAGCDLAGARQRVLPVVVRLLPALRRRRAAASSWSRTARRRSPTPTAQPVANFWAEMYEKGYAPKEKYNGDSFADEKAAMAIVGPWAIAVYGDKVDWGAAPVPTASGTSAEETCTFSDAKNVAIYSACKAKGTAWDVLKFATSKEQDGSCWTDRPDADARRTSRPPTRTTSPSNPDYKAFADAGRAHGRGAQRAQLDRDLADVPRRLHATP